MRLLGHSYKSKQFFFALLKLCIVLLAFYSIWIKLIGFSENDFLKFLSSEKGSLLWSPKLFALLISLSFFNWLFEIMKWQTLISHVKNISFLESAKETLGALTASIMTPNRIGEYGAKAYCYASNLRVKVVFLNFVGHMTQLAATLVFGVFGLAFMSRQLSWQFPKVSLSYTILGASLGLLIGYFLLKNRTISVKGYSLKRLFKFLKKLEKSKLLKAQLFAFLRYMTFSFQMVMLFQLMGVNLSICTILSVVWSMYLLSSILPSIVIFDVIVKGSIAMYLFALFGVPEMITAGVVGIMWIFNMVLPSIIGSYFVLTFKPVQPAT